MTFHDVNFFQVEVHRNTETQTVRLIRLEAPKKPGRRTTVPKVGSETHGPPRPNAEAQLTSPAGRSSH
jgi:hypothetical protein